MVIRPTDRVSAVLERDERLVDVFVAASPTFERLRNRAMRKVMARLVTVAQAARMAGLEPDELVARLDAALGDAAGRGDAGDASEPAIASSPEADSATGDAALPAHLAALPPERVVDIDVRPDLRRGEEPFSKIMAARRSLPPGGVLRLAATFEPVPLYAVLGKQGFGHWTEQLGEDDWRVWFFPEAGASAGASSAAPGGATAAAATPDAGAVGSTATADAPEAEGDDVVILDVRGLEPPEPMQRTLEALETLPAGKTLLHINVREPRFLLPILAERGWTYELRSQPGQELVRVFIRREAES